MVLIYNRKSSSVMSSPLYNDKKENVSITTNSIKRRLKQLTPENKNILLSLGFKVLSS